MYRRHAVRSDDPARVPELVSSDKTDENDDGGSQGSPHRPAASDDSDDAAGGTGGGNGGRTSPRTPAEYERAVRRSLSEKAYSTSRDERPAGREAGSRLCRA